MTIAGQTRITPEQVGSVSFAPARLGRRGIDDQQVREFLGVVQDEMRRLYSERAQLIDEVQRLRSRLMSHQAEEEMPPYTAGDAHEQAVRILSNAQQTADQYVADAHAYSRDITEEARRRGDEILTEARSRAGTEPPPSPGLPVDPQRLEDELAYLRTFSEVCRTHLRTYLAALTHSIDEWENADARSLPPRPAPFRTP